MTAILPAKSFIDLFPLFFVLHFAMRYSSWEHSTASSRKISSQYALVKRGNLRGAATASKLPRLSPLVPLGVGSAYRGPRRRGWRYQDRLNLPGPPETYLREALKEAADEPLA